MEANINVTNSIITGSFSILAMTIGYYIAARKYIFEKTYDRKLLYIMDFYKQIVNLEFAVKRYVHFIGADLKEESTNKRIEALNQIKSDFQKFQHEYWEVEIILNDDLVEKIEKFLRKYIEITSKLSRSNIEQQLHAYDDSFDSWDESFKLVTSDLVQIKNELKKDFKRTLASKI